jgi:ribose-phosphate pyrophosphokinase
MQSRIIIFSGNSNLPLALKVCSALDVSLCKALVGRFSDGEVRVEIGENVRGMDVYVIQSTCPPVNENLVEFLVMIDALKRASARRINTVIPYYGYGRQDQKEKPRVSVASKMVADLLTVAGADRVITIDLHADQIEGFFKIPVDHLMGTHVLLDDLKTRLQGGEIIVAPDAGGVERARGFAKRLNVDLAVMDHRSTVDEASSRMVGNVKGRRVIILDDMVDTGSTLIRTAKGAEAAGAASIEAYCVHAVLSGDAGERIDASPIRFLTVTDTVPLPSKVAQVAKIRTVSIAAMLAETIRRVHYEESVSSLFSRS